MTSQYDPPSPGVLATVAAEVLDALHESVRLLEHWRNDLDPLFGDHVPPFVSEHDVGLRCRDDWHGGNPGPGIRRIVDDLREARAIVPLRRTARDALEGFDRRWAELHRDRRPPDVRSAQGYWELLDTARFEQVLSARSSRGSLEVRPDVRQVVERWSRSAPDSPGDAERARSISGRCRSRSVPSSPGAE